MGSYKMFRILLNVWDCQTDQMFGIRMNVWDCHKQIGMLGFS